jgi:predicted DNA-binding transcriptional regulator AlpA
MARKAIHLMGLAEAAAAAGISKQTLSAMRNREKGAVPPPAVLLECGPIWLAADIETWVKQREARRLQRG